MDRDDYDALRLELKYLQKTCEVLKQRVEKSMDGTDASWSTFMRQAHLERLVEERTQRHKLEAERAAEENRKRARVEALLNDAQRLAKVGGWMFDLADETTQYTREFYRIFEIDGEPQLSLEETLQYYQEDFRKELEKALTEAIGSKKPFDIEGRAKTAKGNDIWVRVQARVYTEDGRASRILGLTSNVTERKLVESRAAQSQKMESVGQLAAGIAHEINTPIQFVSDNTRFLQTSFADIQTALSDLVTLIKERSDASVGSEADGILDGIDYDFLKEEVPSAIQQSLEGLGRVAKLVQAMKDYAHPGRDQKEHADLNRAIESTATVARNEWKYVAALEFDFDPALPTVPCLLADVNQVVLNMIVNAAHAIEERFGRSEDVKGKIRISTRADGDWAVVTISDNGNGMPEHVMRRIFDPFFTTKEVGVGTGQGLAISHQVIVERHAGLIDVSSVPGEGTTFTIRLPLA